MDHDLQIAILSMQVIIVGWLLAHTFQCAKRDSRVTSLEQWRKDLEGK